MSMARKQDLLIWVNDHGHWCTFQYATINRSPIVDMHEKSIFKSFDDLAHDDDDRPLTKCEFYKYE